MSQPTPRSVVEAPHLPVLDGVRGLAIALVIAFHCVSITAVAKADWLFTIPLSCGWTGVDLFFVLSGFLITGILLDTRGSARYFRSFYARRVLRIFPLYYAILVLSLWVLPGLLPAHKAARFGAIAGDTAYYWVYLSNLVVAKHGFRHAVLDVTWSLAIEEQFYLLWPIIVLFASRRALVRVAVAVLVSALALRVLMRLGLGSSGFATYVLTPCRIDALAAGALVAALSRGPGGLAAVRGHARTAALIAGPIAAFALVRESLTVNWVTLPGETVFMATVGFTAIDVTFAALLVRVLTDPPDSALHRLFNTRTLRTFGKYSYGMYLFHLPIRAVIRDLAYGAAWTSAPIKFHRLLGSEVPGQLLFIPMAMAASLAVAWISYRVFEAPILRLKRFFPAERAIAVVSRAAP